MSDSIPEVSDGTPDEWAAAPQGECESCGKVKPVLYMRDPFLWEVWDEIKTAWFCEECEDQRRMDI